MAATYDQNAIVRITGRFKNLSNALSDPSIVTVYIENPSKEFTTYSYEQAGPQDAEVVRESAGVYHVDVDPAGVTGMWSYRFEGSGGGVNIGGDGKFKIVRSRVLTDFESLP